MSVKKKSVNYLLTRIYVRQLESAGQREGCLAGVANREREGWRAGGGLTARVYRGRPGVMSKLS